MRWIQGFVLGTEVYRVEILIVSIYITVGKWNHGFILGTKVR